LVRKSERKIPLGGPGMGGRILIITTHRQDGRSWTRYMWPRIGTSSRPL